MTTLLTIVEKHKAMQAMRNCWIATGALALGILMLVDRPASSQQRSAAARSDSMRRLSQRMDNQGNGARAQKEVSPDARRSVDPKDRDAKAKSNQPPPIEKISEASFSSSRSSGRDRVPLVVGFGVEDQLTKVPGFGVLPESLGGRIVALNKRYNRRVLLYVEQLLARSDGNRDGILDGDELQNMPWKGDPRDSDLNKDGRLTKAELCEHFARRWRLIGKSQTSSPTTGSPTRNQSFRSRDGSFNLTRYVERFDRNKDGVLRPEEIDTRTKRITDRLIRNAGFDPNKPIKLSELNKAVQSRSRAGSRSGSSSSDNSSADSSEGASYTIEGTKLLSGRRSYRFLAPTERLPRGLPLWWNRRDADADGQVMMAEFSNVWSAARFAEFARYDLNGDGVITPNEAAQKNQTSQQAAR